MFRFAVNCRNSHCDQLLVFPESVLQQNLANQEALWANWVSTKCDGHCWQLASSTTAQLYLQVVSLATGSSRQSSSSPCFSSGSTRFWCCFRSNTLTCLSHTYAFQEITLWTQKGINSALFAATHGELWLFQHCYWVVIKSYSSNTHNFSTKLQNFVLWTATQLSQVLENPFGEQNAVTKPLKTH